MPTRVLDSVDVAHFGRRMACKGGDDIEIEDLINAASAFERGYVFVVSDENGLDRALVWNLEVWMESNTEVGYVGRKEEDLQKIRGSPGAFSECL